MPHSTKAQSLQTQRGLSHCHLSSRQTPETSEEPLGRVGHSTSDTCKAGPGGKPRGHLKGTASSSAAGLLPCHVPAHPQHGGDIQGQLSETKHSKHKHLLA